MQIGRAAGYEVMIGIVDTLDQVFQYSISILNNA